MTDQPAEPRDPHGRHAPRDPAEVLVHSLFRELLERESVPLATTFRELGGDSLRALQLQERIWEGSGRELSQELIWETGSVETIARLVRETPPETSGRRLTRLTPPDAPMVYCVHAVVGMALKYRRLAELLAMDGVGAAAFQARGLMPFERPCDDLHRMAAEYAAELRGGGAVSLLGYSMGAIVAYETAALLERDGVEVADLFLVDTFAPTERARWDHLMDAAPPEVILASALNGEWDREELMNVAPPDRLAWLHERAMAARLLPPGYRPPDLARLVDVVNAHITALDRYRPGMADLAADVTVLAVRQDNVPGDLWWSHTLRREPKVVLLPGPHHLLLDSPNVEIIAATVAESLRGNGGTR
jgi:thioesterase domain-containing protein/acyl carrier protein